MHYIDVFNGDADGICALIQLRRSNPQSASLVTGVKRDVSLLKQVEFVNSAHITVLDISFKKNVKDVERLLNQGAIISYIDHHQTGKLLEHEHLHIDIDLSVDTCTSLIVDQQLQGQYRAWALTAAFGDNLSDKAMALGLESGLMHEQLVQLKEFGTYLNYNSYGISVDDLFYSPPELFQKLVKFDCPFEFLQQDKDVFKTLSEAYKHDMEKANKCSFIHESNNTAVIHLPNEQWANRISGVYSNELANRYPDRAHATITSKRDSNFLVSVRAPLNNKQGADELVSQFPTGGGRKAAAGINALPQELLKGFIDAFEKQYS